MNGGDDINRRTLLLRSLSAAPMALSPALLEALQHAHTAAASDTPPRLEFFDAPTAAEIEAIAAEVIPSGATPGAREAGVIWFIDRALAGFDRHKRELYRRGLGEAQAAARRLFPGSTSIAALSGEQRIRLLQSIEQGEFFAAVRVHTITAFLAGPRWGGNRGQAGWKLIGHQDAGQFQPPFGYYDREADIE